MEMRTYETVTNSTTNNNNKPIVPPTTTVLPIVSTEKITKTDGTVSDSGVSSLIDTNKKRRPSKQSKAFVILGLSKKANSSSSLGLGKYIFSNRKSSQLLLFKVNDLVFKEVKKLVFNLIYVIVH